MSFMFSPAAQGKIMPDNHLVERRDGRSCIVAAATGQVIYTPPDFLKGAITSQADLQLLAEALNRGERYIDAVAAFEASFARGKPSRQRSAGVDALVERSAQSEGRQSEEVARAHCSGDAQKRPSTGADKRVVLAATCSR
jgi:hypothetical protein